MTETGMNTSNPYDGDCVPVRRSALAGGEVIVTDPETETMRGGQHRYDRSPRAECLCRILGHGGKNAADLRANGFFITGDLGVIDDDGYVTIVGRNRDLIISGGFNIYPREIELLIDAAAGVTESAVFGVPHPDFGETPVALIVAEAMRCLILTRSPGFSQSLARFKHPRHLEIVMALPRNAMGKVQKNILRDQYAHIFCPGKR